MKKKKGIRGGGGGGGEKDDEAGETEAGSVDGTGGTWRVDLLALMLQMVRVLLGAEYYKRTTPRVGEPPPPLPLRR